MARAKNAQPFKARVLNRFVAENNKGWGKEKERIPPSFTPIERTHRRHSYG